MTSESSGAECVILRWRVFPVFPRPGSAVRIIVSDSTVVKALMQVEYVPLCEGSGSGRTTPDSRDTPGRPGR